jgi:ribosomal protein S18 acetylase RimI-like enzyme
MSLVAVTPLDLGDAAHGAALVQLLDHYASEPMGGGTPLSSSVREGLVSALRKQPNYLGFLAFIEERAVGLANCFLGFSTFRARPLLNVHDLMVHRDFRRRGIARRLLEEVEISAVRQGCCKLTLEVLSENRAARSAYEAVGFRSSYLLGPGTGAALFLEKKVD